MEPDPQPPLIQEISFVTEEEARLASSDLEDCEEIWKGELGNYIMETHKRQKQVDAWFSRWIIVSSWSRIRGWHILIAAKGTR